LLAEDDSDLARGVQDFGVAHRVRVPSVKWLKANPSAMRRGRLPDRRVLEIGTIDLIGDEERMPFAPQLARAAELHRIVLALVEIEPARRLLGLLVLAKAARPGATEAVRSLRKSGLTIALANSDAVPEDREALAGLELGSMAASEPQQPAIGIVPPGEPPPEHSATTVRFGGRSRPAAEQSADIVVARDDPRTLVDLLQFARDFRTRVRIAIVVANLPGIVLLAAALGFMPASPLLLTIAALAGIVLAAASPQALRPSSTIANEVDEE
jgi:cation transport ATPase